MESWQIIVVIVGIIAVFVFQAFLKKAKCPRCGVRKANIVSREQIRVEQVFFKEKQRTLEYKNTNKTFAYKSETLNPPDKIIEHEILIPGIRAWYTIKYKCSKCGNLFSREEYVDKKSKIV